MRSFIVLPIILILTLTPTIEGQTRPYTILGYEREIGPLELSLCSSHWIPAGRTVFIPSAFQTETPAIEQPPIGDPIVGGVIGSFLGMLVGGTGALVFSDWVMEKPIWPLSIASGMLVQPLIMGSFVHAGNDRLGDYWLVLGTAFASWIAPMAYPAITEQKA